MLRAMPPQLDWIMATLILIRRAIIQAPIAPWECQMSGLPGAPREGIELLRMNGDTSWDSGMLGAPGQRIVVRELKLLCGKLVTPRASPMRS
jgi:hypothetical protein